MNKQKRRWVNSYDSVLYHHLMSSLKISEALIGAYRNGAFMQVPNLVALANKMKRSVMASSLVYIKCPSSSSFRASRLYIF